MTRSWLRAVGIVGVMGCWTGPLAISLAAEDPSFFAAPPPGEISVGEAQAVPFRQPAAAAGTAAAPPSIPPASATPGTGWLGFAADDTLVPGRLVFVDVAPGGPAARAGIAPQDTLLGINGHPLRTADELAAALAPLSPGTPVKMSVGRGDWVEDKSLVAEARPAAAVERPDWQGSTAPATKTVAPPARFPSNPDPFTAPERVESLPPPASVVVADPLPRPADAKGRTALGVRTVRVDPDVQSRYRLPGQRGAYVIGVVHDLPASKAGIPPGSVIVALGNQPVSDPGDLTRLVTGGPVGAPVSLEYVLPGGESRRADVVLQSLELPLERALLGGGPPEGGEPSPLPLQARRPAVSQPRDPSGQMVTELERSSPRESLEQEVILLRLRIEALERRLDPSAERRLR
jgi:membrane-associated protease RseP (regulator of RpoE activity)